MEKIFLPIFSYFKKRRSVFYIIFITCFLTSGFFASRIQLEEDISKILPDDKKIQKLNEVFQGSKFMDKLVITVSMKDTTRAVERDSLVLFADEFVSRLNQNLKPFIRSIQDKVDEAVALEMFGSIHQNLPVYLEKSDYKSIDSLVNPQTIKQTLQNNIRFLSSPAGFAFKNVIVKDPTGISMLGIRKLQQLQYDENFELYDNYVVTKNGRYLMLFVTPAYPSNNTGKNAKLLKGIDHIVDTLEKTEYRNINVSYFGAPAVSAGNAAQLRRDSFLTQGITIAFLIVFIGLYFRKKAAPFLVLVPVVFGCLFSLAVVYLVQEKISVIALATGSVVLGIAINYSLHVFNHFRHTRDLRTVIKDLSTPMTIGSFTTIGGFICLQFVQSEMLKDLGLFAACALIGASLCSLIFLPHLIAAPAEKQAVRIDHTLLDKIAAYRPERNKFLVIVILLLTGLFAYTSRFVHFETDMMRMNYMPEELRTAERQLNTINAYSLQSLYLVSSGRDLNEALRNNEKAIGTIEDLRDKNVVTKYSGVSSLIISDSLKNVRVERWKNYWTAGKKQAVLETLKKEGTALNYRPNAFEDFEKLISKNYTISDDGATKAIRSVFLSDFVSESPGKATVVTLLKANREKKNLIYEAFKNNNDITVVDKQYLAERLVEIVKFDFTSIALMSSLLVFGVLLISFGRIELALVSFIPMFITWVWILGIMGLLGIEFNIVNIIISTLIFGLGDDYSLFIMDGLLQEYKTGRRNLASYKSSIFLSAITTLAGLGVLIFAQHPALQSIALIAIIGIACVVMMSQILIPFFFHVLIKNRTATKRFPWTLRGFAKSAFAFSYFLTGCILLTIAAILFIKLNPFNREKGKLIYHTILSKFAWSLIYIMGNVRKQIFNPLNERFEKPAVVVANHQSFLDILVMIMLHPKLVLLTNQWVWNSPVFGFVVRMADYYPVMQGAEPGIETLAEKVKNGYSVVVFPEGTRSPDGNMKRFHKGAFFLAEKLAVDILPIVIHGTGYTMTKNDFLLKDGNITLQYLPRIRPADKSWGEGYAERSKKIGRYFRDQFNQLRNALETPHYYKEQLLYNYIYKGPVLEWYMRIKIRLENNYKLFDELVPREGKILDIGCGYGFMAYMLHFVSSKREITGLDYDEEKIATANHCFSKNALIQFTVADILQYPMELYDSIIMSDILHYLKPNQQREIIEKCIRHLSPGGNIIIREGNKDLEKRHKGTRLTEFFSTRVVRFNKTSPDGLSFLSGNLIKDIAKSEQLECIELDNTKFTSNIIFELKKNFSRDGAN